MNKLVIRYLTLNYKISKWNSHLGATYCINVSGQLSEPPHFGLIDEIEKVFLIERNLCEYIIRNWVFSQDININIDSYIQRCRVKFTSPGVYTREYDNSIVFT